MNGRRQISTLPPMPPELVAQGIDLRPETPEDIEFLRQLYLSVRWEELAPSGWPEDAKTAFLNQQFDYQTRHYKSHYHGAAWGIVIDGDRPVGRLYLHQGVSDLRIIDISMLPGYRGRGIGTELIRAVFDLGQEAETNVSIHVESFNHGARRLYERLGFVETGSNGVHYRMDWIPPSPIDAPPATIVTRCSVS